MPRDSRRIGAALLGGLLALLGAPSPALSDQAVRGDHAGSWASYNRSYDSQRYVPLRQINRGNVDQLRPLCEAQLGEMGPLQAGLLVVEGRILVTTPRTTLALDARNCRVLWRHVHAESGYLFSPSNRGPAYADHRVYRGTADCFLLAIDVRNGRELWKRRGCDPQKSEILSSAPLVWGRRVYIGTSGGDWGGQSRVMAFDARDGHELWHFNVIPADGEPGADSWRLAAGARRSGGAVWGAYSLDPATGELFVSTGNPAPALAPGLREGANLYTDSVLALDAASGRLHWYVQATAGDALDYDLSAAPMLYADARGRRRVAAGSKDGNLYLIDRESHAIVSKVPVTTIENPTAIPTVEGVRACPGVYGGVAWNGPAFDPASGTLYVGSIDMCMIYKYHGGDLSNPAVSFGTMAFNSDAPGDSIHGWVSAVDGTSGKLRWRRWTEAPVIAGVTVTGGGLVLTGDSHGRFLALDAQTGALLRSFETGGTMAGGVVTYDAGGRQYVAYASGGVVRGNLVKDVVEPKVVIAALAPASHTLRRVVVPSLDPMPPASGSAAPSGARGAALYARLCTLCHGPQGEGLTAPRLRGVRQRADVRSLREIIEDPKPSMARFYPGMITEADVADLAAFLEAWN